MHIAHVFPSRSWGGAEIYCLELASRQKAKGLSVSVWGSEGSRLLNEAKKRGLQIRTQPVAQRLDLLSLPRLVKYVRKEKITHLHLHWSGGMWAFAGINAFVSVKMIYQNHLWISHYKIDPFHMVAHAQIDALIVAGRRAEANARKMWKFSAKKIHVIPYGIDLSRAKGVHTKPDPMRLTFGLFARIDRQKGIREFLHALFSIIEDTNIFAIIVGDPTLNESDALAYNQEIESLIDNSRFKVCIRRLPSTPEYLKLLGECDVLVVPSYHESYSLMILDAFMLGKPVLATDSGGTPDLVTDERGWLVPAKDAHALSEKMKSISASGAQEISKRGVSAREYVEREHAFDKVATQIIAIYKSL